MTVIDDPQDASARIDLEETLIGAIFVRPETLDAVRGQVRPEHFADPFWAWVYETLLTWADAGQPLSIAAFTRHYSDTFKDSSQLRCLVDMLASPFNLFHDPATVAHEIWAAGEVRLLQQALGKLSVKAFSHPAPLAAEVEKLTAEVADSADETAFSFTGAAAAAALLERVGSGDDDGRIRCPRIPELDELTGGLDKDWLVILGGRPGMGKTSLALEIARNACEQGQGVAFFSKEMSALQLMSRLMSQMSLDAAVPVPSTDIDKKKLDVAQVRALREIEARIATWPLYINDRPGLTIARIRHWARTYKRLCEARKVPLGLLVVDYLQLVAPSKSNRSRTEDVTEIAMAMKRLAKELRVPVLALSQLSRAVEQRDNKRPHLADLRESGQIEQDADVVLFCYREEYYLAKKKPKPGEEVDYDRRLSDARGRAEVICDKHRFGQTGFREVRFVGAHQAFRTSGATA